MRYYCCQFEDRTLSLFHDRSQKTCSFAQTVYIQLSPHKIQIYISTETFPHLLSSGRAGQPK